MKFGSFNLLVIPALLLSLLGSALIVTPALAAGILVNSSADGVANDGVCTLREAITAANTNTSSGAAAGECAAGSGTDTITFAADYTITLAGSQLPAVTTTVTITGKGEAKTILQASACNPVTLPGGCTPAKYRVLEVGSAGDLTLENLTIQHGNCVEQSPNTYGYCESENWNGSLSGGGIYNTGALNTSHVTLSSNAARYYGGGIYSTGSGTLTYSTIRNNSAIHYAGGIYTSGGNPTLDHVTFSDNYAGDFGGGLFNDQNSPTLIHVTFNGNTTNGSGGGMINYAGGSPTLTNVTFSTNSVSGYGGGFMSVSGDPTLTRVTFSGNSATGGGGLYSSGDSLALFDVTFNSNQAIQSGGGMLGNGFTATDLTFSNNSAGMNGGGIFVSSWSSSASLTNATFSGNSAYYDGGGMYSEGTFTMTNVTFSGNSASYYGGGLSIDSGSATLNNITFNGNSAAEGGGGISNESDLTLNNVIITNSSAGGDCQNTGSSMFASNTLIESIGSSACGFTHGVDGNIIGSDPNLGSLANNYGKTKTHALLPGSPAIDQGSNCAAKDQRGIPRQGSGCDIGAYEYGAVIPVITASNPSANAVVLTSLSSINITFNQDMKNDGSAKAANTTANYLLVERGANDSFDTLSCAGGLVSDDVQQTISAAIFNDLVLMSTLTLASPLDAGVYRLFICGTTSIWSEADIKLNNGLADATVDFTVNPTASIASSLPKTGFAPSRITSLPAQPANSTYAALGDLWLEIPSLKVKTSIVGVPQNKDKSWDVSWLGNDAGWLNGTAFPTWNGNSVLTAHVINASGLNGPFAALKNLQYGEQVVVHMDGLKYIYEVRGSKLARPSSTSFAFQSLQDHSYLTLITCQGFNPLNEAYLFRRIVRAVLVSVESE